LNINETPYDGLMRCINETMHLTINGIKLNKQLVSYTSEIDIGSVNGSGTVTDNKANVYCWSFSSNPVLALEKGLLLGHRRFQGNEQLQLNFTSALAAAVQVDVFAYSQSAIEQGAGFVKVYAL
jgi:hypothetical protein